MQLVEVMVAASVFMAAALASSQLFTQVAGSSQQSEHLQQQLERIEFDRLQLEAHWLRRRQSLSSCSVAVDHMSAVAAEVSPPPQVHRELLAGERPEELRLRWRIASWSAPLRQRLVTAAGLGVCAGSQDATQSVPEGGE